MLLMVVSELTELKDLTSCGMPHVIGCVVPDVSCRHGALILRVNQLVVLDYLNQALCFFGPSGTTHSAAQYNISEDLNLQHHWCENPKSWFHIFSNKVINTIEIIYMYSEEC